MDLEKLQKNLEKKGFSFRRFATGREAAAYLDAAIDGKTVGIGGSMTVTEIGLYPALASHNDVAWHHITPGDETMLAACNAQVYITSANGISENGDIINIDGRGNRVAGTLMKKEKVYIIVGVNKIAPDFETALDRARNCAGPKNSARLQKKTPCAAAGHCFDCAAPERICSALVVFWQKPFWAEEMEVVLVDEELGY